MYKLTLSLIFLSIVNKNITYSRKFRVSNYIFRKAQGIDLQITQSSGRYNTLNFVKMHIPKYSGSHFALFKM